MNSEETGKRGGGRNWKGKREKRIKSYRDKNKEQNDSATSSRLSTDPHWLTLL